MSPSARPEPLNHSTSRTVAASLGTLPVSLLMGIALATVLPLGTEQRYLIGSYAVVPLWGGLACSVLLASSARRAWAALAVLSGAAALLAFVAQRLR